MRKLIIMSICVVALVAGCATPVSRRSGDVPAAVDIAAHQYFIWLANRDSDSLGEDEEGVTFLYEETFDTSEDVQVLSISRTTFEYENPALAVGEQAGARNFVAQYKVLVRRAGGAPESIAIQVTGLLYGGGKVEIVESGQY